MKKLFVLLFALLVCAACLMACNKEAVSEKKTEGVTDSEPVTEGADSALGSDPVVDDTTPEESKTTQATAVDTVSDPDALDERISQEELKTIVLLHAGLSEDQISAYFVLSDYDDDRGIPEYDVSFYAGDFEYDYEVNALTGEITDFEKESKYD